MPAAKAPSPESEATVLSVLTQKSVTEELKAVVTKEAKPFDIETSKPVDETGSPTSAACKPARKLRNCISKEQKRKMQKRERKNQNQYNLLVKEFAKNPFWTKSQIVHLSQSMGLKENQIYKWNWDMQRKQKAKYPDASAVS